METNYKILNDLGMIDEDVDEKKFNEITSSLLDTAVFLDDLFLTNSEETLKRFLLIALYRGK